MSVYGSGVEAYRSTAKWLVSFVPVAAIVAAGISFGPELVDRAASLDEREFWRRHQLAVIGTFLIAGGLVILFWKAAALLSKRAPDVTNLDTNVLDEAFGAGVAVPYFADRFTYEDAQARLTAWVDSKHSGYTRAVGDPDPAQPDAELVKALAETVDALREWALHREIAAEFWRFNIWYGGGVFVMVAGLLVAAINLNDSEPERREPPIAVEAVLTDGAWESMNSTLGCGDTIDGVRPDVDLWLVAGDWQDPILQVDGDGCDSATDWRPGGSVAVRPLSK